VARQPRIQVAGGVYHVFSRGNARQAVFDDALDRRRFLEILERAAALYGWTVLGYCLMGNHYHLVVRIAEPNLARGMRYLNGRYAQWRNRRYGRVGHVFQGRYGAVVIQRGDVLRRVLRYVARNPVEAGLVERAVDWPWSSHRAVVGLVAPGLVAVSVVLAEFGDDRVSARQAYVQLVNGETEDAPVGHPVVIGDDDFTRAHLALIEPCAAYPAGTQRPLPPPLASFGSFESAELLVEAWRAGYTIRELAEHLGCGVATVHRRLRAASAGGPVRA
jgi:REP element-mobilizing transposase RayT